MFCLDVFMGIKMFCNERFLLLALNVFSFSFISVFAKINEHPVKFLCRVHYFVINVFV